MQVFSIYKATNKINGKVYIGFTNNFVNRKRKHLNYYNKNYSTNYNSVFHKAIRKHGWKNFEWEVICQSLDGEYLLQEMESYFIRYYNSHYIEGYGYNMTKGGEGCLGYKHSEKIKKGLAVSLKGNNNAKGHIVSKEAKQIMSNLAKQRSPNHTKNYILYSPEGTQYKINNLLKFMKNNPQFNLISQGNLIEVANGKRKHYKGWKVIKF